LKNALVILDKEERDRIQKKQGGHHMPPRPPSFALRFRFEPLESFAALTKPDGFRVAIERGRRPPSSSVCRPA
jgi:hypothetical protein